MSDQTTTERFADDARRYRLESRIATGGMGEVWRAEDTVLGRTVAVKLLKAEYADDPSFRGRFETEARNAAALHHPNVAGVFDFGQAAPTDGSSTPRPYLVMELVEGQPLSALLRPGQPMDPAIATDILAQAADGIGAAHRAGIVHRDIKPANLLVTRDRTVKITDFGIARAGDTVSLTQTGMVMGTPQYISPEQAQGQNAGPAADVYSLGVVAFECLAGRRPFVAETAVATALAHLRDPVPDLPGDVPPGLANVVRRSLAKAPGDRFEDGTAFARALRDPSALPGTAAAVGAADDSTQVLTGVGAPVPPPSQPVAAAAPVVPVAATTVEREEEEPKRRSALPWVAAALALLLVGLLIWLAVATSGGDDEDPLDTPTTPVTTSAPPSTEPTTEEPTTEPTTEEPTSEAPPEPETFDLDAQDYVGRDIDDVASDLEGRGLRVVRDERDNSGGEIEGTVTDVTPTTNLEAGDTVTVRYWGPEPEPEPTEEPDEGNGNGNGAGNGNGNGNGNGGTQTTAPTTAAP
ncbi:serine/threonine-protein kinase [Nocardioides sp. CPCC 205120]|uniref:serine/threonine-protein kinase n=1 Tax=Nocardioides sp. CPCC 205120 TaxID=3406462 RepID=UPI003B507C38